MSKPALDPLQRLGQTVAAQQDQQLASHPSLREARARLLSGAPARRSRWLPSPALVFAASAALTALALLVPGVVGSRLSPLSFQEGSHPGAVDAWLAAPTAAPLPLRFSDGSALDLGPGARARVASVSPEGARVVIEHGRADVAVVHRRDTRWALSAGPFEVRVTGTRFAVEWDAAHEVFRLAMAEGSVVVTGACLPGPTTFRGGDALSLACPARPASTSSASARVSGAVPPSGVSAPVVAPSASAAEPPPSAPVLAPSLPSPPVPGPAPTTASVAPAVPPGPVGSAAIDWKEAALARRHRDALAAAEASGFESVCAGASAGDLALLADAARFAGSTGRARQALTTLRSRFAGDGRAATAAFTLGRMAFDQQGAYGEAAGWFATYLAEQPGGSLAQEALGRLIEARQRAGDGAGARAAAQQYLARFPGGAHDALARRLVGDAAP